MVLFGVGGIMLCATLAHRLKPSFFWVERIDRRTEPLRYSMFLVIGIAAVALGIYRLAVS